MNEFEAANRIDKAWRLVNALEHFYKQHGKQTTAPELLPHSILLYAQTFTPDNWAALAGLYGIKSPSEATVEVVLNILRDSAGRKNKDPFSLLEGG